MMSWSFPNTGLPYNKLKFYSSEIGMRGIFFILHVCANWIDVLSPRKISVSNASCMNLLYSSLFNIFLLESHGNVNCFDIFIMSSNLLMMLVKRDQCYDFE